ncbi:hypothetical protein N9H78_03635 [Winogradskyella sp.]|nr:hypothetical protein [Winogradskyella sp.]MDA8874745.1 hypothetical protein [Winogradskyella sp.]
MSKVIRTSIVFELNLDQDPLIEMLDEDMTDEELLEYARKTMTEDLIQMSYDSGADLMNAIEAEVINV